VYISLIRLEIAYILVCIDFMKIAIALLHIGVFERHMRGVCSALEHFRDHELFFRQTKMGYIPIVTENIVAKILQSKPMRHYAIGKRIVTHNQAVRIKELR
jgi:hypothetical protein